jgi:hypothetical protein
VKAVKFVERRNAYANLTRKNELFSACGVLVWHVFSTLFVSFVLLPEPITESQRLLCCNSPAMSEIESHCATVTPYGDDHQPQR